MRVFKKVKPCSRTCKIISIVALAILAIIIIRTIIHINKDYKIVTYGDSITAGFTWQPYLEDYYGESILNLGIGASGFTHDGQAPATLDATNVLIARLQESELEYRWERIYKGFLRTIRHLDATPLLQHNISTTRLSADERLNTIPKSTERIFVMAGTNDAGKNYNDSVFLESYERVISYIKANTNSKIILMSPIHCKMEYEDSVYAKNMKSIRNNIECLSLKHNLYYIDVSQCGLDSSNFAELTADSVHPKRTGGKLIGQYIIEKLKGW